MRISSARTLPSPIARRTLRMFRERSLDPWSTSTTGVKGIYRNLPNALTARRPVGRPSAWQVIINHFEASERAIDLFAFRISLWMVRFYIAWRLPSLCLRRVHVRPTLTHLSAASRRLYSKNWSANGSNNRCSSEEQRSSHDARIFMP